MLLDPAAVSGNHRLFAIAYYCLPEYRHCRPADDNITRLNHFTSRYSPSVALPTLSSCRYLHKPKARFPVGWLAPCRCGILTRWKRQTFPGAPMRLLRYWLHLTRTYFHLGSSRRSSRRARWLCLRPSSVILRGQRGKHLDSALRKKACAAATLTIRCRFTGKALCPLSVASEISWPIIDLQYLTSAVTCTGSSGTLGRSVPAARPCVGAASRTPGWRLLHACAQPMPRAPSPPPGSAASQDNVPIPDAYLERGLGAEASAYPGAGVSDRCEAHQMISGNCTDTDVRRRLRRASQKGDAQKVQDADASLVVRN